ncbi:MAG: ComF family protein, partial [Pirellulaceae bacterium]|nr:ComF family protein [Pirellulaceae bacterium]
ERRMLVRARATDPQADLSPQKRLENVRGAFRLGTNYVLGGVRVLLVDDIMTTGATCSEAAKVLRKAGAEAVFAAVVARTLGPDAEA